MGRVCTIKGSLEEVLIAHRLIFDNIMKLETNLNGVKYEK